MMYTELLAKLQEVGNLRNYIYKHYGEIYSKICKIIESIPDEEISEILQTDDLIGRITVTLMRSYKNEPLYKVTFMSCLQEEDYDVIIPVDDYSFATNLSRERVDVLPQEHTLEIYSENASFFNWEDSEEKLKKALGDDYIKSDTNTLVVKNTFFD